MSMANSSPAVVERTMTWMEISITLPRTNDTTSLASCSTRLDMYNMSIPFRNSTDRLCMCSVIS